MILIILYARNYFGSRELFSRTISDMSYSFCWNRFDDTVAGIVPVGKFNSEDEFLLCCS